MTWIIGPGGLILYKAAWTCARDVGDALEAALEQRERRRSRSRRVALFYSERLAWREDEPDVLREGLERIGPQAVRDYFGE